MLTLGVAVRKPGKLEKEDAPTADFFNITVWGGQAETCAKHLHKGRLVGVSVRLEPTSWKAADDSTRYGMELTAGAVEFLDSPRRAAADSAGDSQEPSLAA
jgi:single-strand DNA-binding protein